MKFTVDRVAFADAVAWAAKAADSAHSTTPVLAGMLIDANEETSLVTLTAFDFEMSCQISIPAAISEPGDCLVSAELLGNVTAVADGDDMGVSCDESTATIVCGRDDWDLALMPAYDFPSLPTFEEPSGWVSADTLTTAFKQVGPIVAKGKGAEIGHSGARIDVSGDTLALAATDRVRLAVTEIDWRSADEEDYVATVPSRLLADFCPAAVGEVGVAFTRGHDGKVTVVALSCAGRVSTIRCIDAPFPDWRAYFGRVDRAVEAAMQADTGAVGAVVKVETDVLLRALKKIGAVVKDRPGNPAKVRIGVAPGEGLHMSGGDVADTLAKSRAEVDADVSGMPFPMLFMHSLLSGVVSGMRCELTSISIHGKLSPVLFEPVTEDVRHRCLLQPLRET